LLVMGLEGCARTVSGHKAADQGGK
jgi:hypothetical protein